MVRPNVLFFVALLAVPCFARDTVILHVSASEMVAVLREHAAERRRPTLTLHDGSVVSGKLRSVSASELTINGRPPIPLCSVRSARVTKNIASSGRRRFGRAVGIFAAVTLLYPLVLAMPSPEMSDFSATALVLGVPITGGVVGTRLAAKHADTLYVMKDDGCAAAAPVAR